MKEELDKKLVSDFPNLYRDRYADKRVTCMCWGFPGDGWEKLIRKASEKIEKEILKMPEDIRVEVKATQVKEKFGTLRFYMSMQNDVIREAIGEAEAKSTVTCEVCGKKGKLRNKRAWIQTLCDKCDKVKD